MEELAANIRVEQELCSELRLPKLKHATRAKAMIDIIGVRILGLRCTWLLIACDGLGVQADLGVVAQKDPSQKINFWIRPVERYPPTYR